MNVKNKSEFADTDNLAHNISLPNNNLINLDMQHSFVSMSVFFLD